MEEQKTRGKARAPEPEQEPARADASPGALAELDGQTPEGAAVAATVKALEEDPAVVLRALARHDIAVNLYMQTEILRRATARASGLIGKNGALSPAVGEDLFKVGRALRSGIKTLADLERMARERERERTEGARGRGAGRPTGAECVARMVLDAQGEGEPWRS